MKLLFFIQFVLVLLFVVSIQAAPVGDDFKIQIEEPSATDPNAGVRRK